MEGISSTGKSQRSLTASRNSTRGFVTLTDEAYSLLNEGWPSQLYTQLMQLRKDVVNDTDLQLSIYFFLFKK